ncbi:MAG: aminotransferase class I/II-fold pyridoxal phosphate-dependent enzyme [Rhodobacteraceae bacterium]|nr:aminotransferase class I/II-fold pyridoxal phosphate-dependent enzyme [Paracoccaceae bacterium]
MRLSKRSDVDAFIVMDVVEAARAAEAAGRDIVHMEVGQPATPAPRGARDALASAMGRDPLGYSVSLGLPELRQKIARLYGDRHSVDLDPARVVVTAGSSAAFVLSFTALFDPGDRVVMGRPGYPSYRQILKALSLTPVEIATTAASGYQLVPGDLPADMSGVIVASPANPSGTVLSRADMTALVDATQARGAAFISDEIYHGLHYATPPTSALEISDDVVVINSFSKYYSMTGWRVGWMVVPDQLVRPIERLQQNMFICAPHASQLAALAAMDCEEELEANRDVYARNRELLVARLPDAGLSRFASPDGAFYVYIDVSEYTDNSVALARDILDRADVAVTPGLDFDPIDGHRSLRLSYAGATDRIEEGLRRLKQYFETHGAR